MAYYECIDSKYNNIKISNSIYNYTLASGSKNSTYQATKYINSGFNIGDLLLIVQFLDTFDQDSDGCRTIISNISGTGIEILFNKSDGDLLRYSGNASRTSAYAICIARATSKSISLSNGIMATNSSTVDRYPGIIKCDLNAYKIY